jgi:hypothetical protein
MSFISVPHDFDPKTAECRGYRIEKQEGGEITPVGFLRGGADLPCDLRKLTENFIAILNGNALIYRDAYQHDMFYERHAGGLNFRFKKPDEAGVSQVGAMFTLLPGVELEFDDNEN